MSKTIDNDYLDALNALGLDRNKDPFPMNTPESVSYWADNHYVLKELVHIQTQAFTFVLSSMYLFWGPKGTGKTFAGSFISNLDTTTRLLRALKKPRDYTVKVIRINAPSHRVAYRNE